MQPTGVAVDSNQNFYVSSESHNQVYEYTQPVALKVPYMQYESDPGFHSRFQREEEIGQKLRHRGH